LRLRGKKKEKTRRTQRHKKKNHLATRIIKIHFGECAAGLSKYVGEKDPTPYVADYIAGYCRRATPTEAEIDALPDLIKLRVLETVVYFVARSASGEDDISQLALRAENYAARVAWIDANAEFIRDAMRAAGRVD
jgi:Ser/Thr protein kinase RdoA (MazF antagonist)